MSEKPIVSIIMGSKSDWATMQKASEMLEQFGVPHECKVVSAHRTPDLRFEAAGFDVIKTENLYNFDGAKGYSA